MLQGKAEEAVIIFPGADKIEMRCRTGVQINERSRQNRQIVAFGGKAKSNNTQAECIWERNQRQQEEKLLQEDNITNELLK